MPLTPAYPGAYVEESPCGVHSIAGVATSLAAFIGRALRGLVDQPVAVNSYDEFERLFGGLWTESTMSYAVRDFCLNGGSQAVIVRIHSGATAAAIPLPTGEPYPNDLLPLIAANVGAWGNKLSTTVDHSTKDRDNAKLFNLTVSEAGGTSEKLFNVSVDPLDTRYVPYVLEQESALIRVDKDGNGNWVVPSRRPTVATFAPKAGSGSDGSPLTQDQYIGPGMESAKTGLYALEKVDLFNLLCIPPYRSDGNVDAAVVRAAAQYCEKRRAMLLVDSPSEWMTTDAAKAGITVGVGTRSKNAALFFPRFRQPNPLRENRMEVFAACGGVAGVFARTDAQRGVWKAPAGLEVTLVGVPQLSVCLTSEANSELNSLGVNCLRVIPEVGPVVWGARTLQGDDCLSSEWKYVPVRRMALFLEESLHRGTSWVVFEPNDEKLWHQIRLNVGAFMQNLFRQGAFAGTTPREAYFVKCDKEATTQDDINRGVVNILVGFAPLKPAEFVIIKIQQMAGHT